MESSMMDRIDAYVAQTTPALMVPTRRPLPPMQAAGHRFLVGRDGLYLEALRAWAHITLPIGPSSIRLPFGNVLQPTLKLLCGSIPREMLAQFEDMARAALPNEVAAWVIWDEHSRTFSLQRLNELTVDRAHVHYERPLLRSHQHLVLDVHSHGTFAPGWSTTDDTDDLATADVKLCGVVGHVDRKPAWRFRLVAIGASVDLAGGELEV